MTAARMTATRRAAAVRIALVGCTAAVAAAGCATAAAPPLDGVRDGERIEWNELHIGMTLEEARARLGSRMGAPRRTEDHCGDVAVDVQREGRDVAQLGFTHGGEEATLHTIVLRIPDGMDREEVLRLLKERIGDLRYRPSPYDPDLPEDRNPKPLYVAEERPEVGVLVGPAEGLVWISALECME